MLTANEGEAVSRLGSLVQATKVPVAPLASTILRPGNRAQLLNAERNPNFKKVKRPMPREQMSFNSEDILHLGKASARADSIGTRRGSCANENS